MVIQLISDGLSLGIPNPNTMLLIILYWEENVNHLTINNSSKTETRSFPCDSCEVKYNMNI